MLSFGSFIDLSFLFLPGVLYPESLRSDGTFSYVGIVTIVPFVPFFSSPPYHLFLNRLTNIKYEPTPTIIASTNEHDNDIIAKINIENIFLLQCIQAPGPIRTPFVFEKVVLNFSKKVLMGWSM